MRPFLVNIAILFLVVGCKKEPDPAQTAEAAGSAAPTAVDPNAPYELTAAKLDAFIRYQQKSIPIYARSKAETEAWQAKAKRGASAAEVTSDQIASQKRSYSETLALQTEHGLSHDDVQKIEKMTSAVLMSRQMLEGFDYPAQIKKLEAARAAAPAAQQSAMDPVIVQTKGMYEDMKNLTTTRTEFGSKNIDLVLSKEAELKKNQAAMLAVGLPGSGK